MVLKHAEKHPESSSRLRISHAGYKHLDLTGLPFQQQARAVKAALRESSLKHTAQTEDPNAAMPDLTSFPYENRGDKPPSLVISPNAPVRSPF